MDLASFLLNCLNKVEPMAEASQSVLRVQLQDYFNKQQTIMENYEKAKEINFQLDQEIEKVPTTGTQEEYQKAVYSLEGKKVDLPKVNLLTRGIGFMSKPMARLALYVLFIIISGWLIKRNLAKTADSEEEEDQDDKRSRPSKKERKILKKWQDYEDIR
ncbi:hypothetical protein [Flavobacterium phage FLiP]|uniref:Uncharacterized protein n=1 Tax=Flavobacterium phage FLiP TaxID=2023716 RepID=A0A222NP80_9VIRU|nr:hypothetical protein HOR88_gp10 [Flavobacterium phage FLiP]ASQ41216.1 hypothetical protein [Flavobacterium phage FLiP]